MTPKEMGDVGASPIQKLFNDLWRGQSINVLV
jgi:hypothetical protein